MIFDPSNIVDDTTPLGSSASIVFRMSAILWFFNFVDPLMNAGSTAQIGRAFQKVDVLSSGALSGEHSEPWWGKCCGNA